MTCVFIVPLMSLAVAVLVRRGGVQFVRLPTQGERLTFASGARNVRRSPGRALRQPGNSLAKTASEAKELVSLWGHSSWLYLYPPWGSRVRIKPVVSCLRRSPVEVIA